MSYDEAFRSVLVSSPAKLSLQAKHLVLSQEDKQAKLFLKDIHSIILESPQITITTALLSALCEHNIIVLTCDDTHHINGILHPYSGHFQQAKVAREQMQVTKQKKSILWQKIIKNKITNQAYVLQTHHKHKASDELLLLASNVALGDSRNFEAIAAAAYFKALFGKGFSREQFCFANSALNYGYAIVRACIVRNVCISGLLPWLGIKHDNMYNSFNLCDDVIEVFRPWVDRCVLELDTPSKDISLQQEDKRTLINILQEKACIDGQSYPLSRAIGRYVQSLKGAMLGKQSLLRVSFET